MKFMKIILFIFLNTFISTCFAILCPSNFNSIEIGSSTIDDVIRLCGLPISKDEYQETISYNEGTSYEQSQGNYYHQTQNNNYSQSGNINANSTNNNQRLTSTKQQVIVHTRLRYTGPQPAYLIFENGILKGRELK